MIGGPDSREPIWPFDLDIEQPAEPAEEPKDQVLVRVVKRL